MSKILKVNVQTTTIGLDNGELLEVPTSSLDFIPNVNDEVEVFKSANETIIRKKENKDTSSVVNNHFYTGKSVNKIAYLLLTFFLGGIGVHKFYVGKTGSGILYLLLCWTFIPTIIALIEFIVALTKPADSNGNIIV